VTTKKKEVPQVDFSGVILGDVQILTDSVAEGEKAGPAKVRFLGTRANVINDNMKMYPLDVLKDAVERAKQKYVIPRKMLGEMPHPKTVVSKGGKISFDSQIDNRVFDIYDLFMDDKGQVFFDAEIMPTQKGRDLMVSLDSKKPVPVSMRALGKSDEKYFQGNKVEVATFMDIISFDAVGNPATEGCQNLQVLTDSQVDALLAEDGIQETPHVCLACSGALEAQDPDDDGDIDFLYCPACEKCFIPESSTVGEVRAIVTLRMVEESDWDSYTQARDFMTAKKASKTMTDSKVGKGDEIDVTKEELQIMLDTQRDTIKSEVKTELEAQYKPIVDTVTAQQTAEQQAAAKAKSKEEAKVFIDSKITELTGKMKPAQLKFITDSVSSAESQSEAEARFDVALKAMNDSTIAQFYNEIGYTGKSGPEGRVYAEANQHTKPWQPIVDRIIAYNDRYAGRLGHQPQPGLREFNKPIIDKIIDHFLVGRIAGFEQMVDSRQYDSFINQHRRQAYGVFCDNVKQFEPLLDDVQGGFEAMVATDDVSVGTAQVFNQPTILTVVLVQAFQECEALQFLWNDVFMGKEWRIPVETFTSAATADALTGQEDLFSDEGVGIAESSIDLGFLHFTAAWRRNAVSVTSDVARELLTGPVHYDTIARAIYHIGFDHRRKIDNAAYDEMFRTSDEYDPTIVSSEIPNSLTSVSDGTNVVYKYNLTIDGDGSTTAGRNPVVIPRTVSYLDAAGQLQSSVINPIAVTVGRSALTGGYRNAAGNIVGAGAGFAVDFENGVMYFTSVAGLNPNAATPIMPSISYSAATNHDYFDLTLADGVEPAFYYNRLLEQLTNTSAMMGSAPRYKVPNLAIFNRISAAYIQNAQMFYKLAQPEGTRLIAQGTYFGDRSEMNLAKVNSPRVSNSRILLTQKGATRYGIQTPYQIKGPYPKYDGSGKIIPADLFYGSENSVMCTPQVVNKDTGIVINPVSRTIKLYKSA